MRVSIQAVSRVSLEVIGRRKERWAILMQF